MKLESFSESEVVLAEQVLEEKIDQSIVVRI